MSFLRSLIFELKSLFFDEVEVRRALPLKVSLRSEGMGLFVPVLRASFAHSLGARRASLGGVEVFSSRRRPISLRAIIRREEALSFPSVLEESASLPVEAFRHGAVRPRARRGKVKGGGVLLRRNRLRSGQVSGRVLSLLSGAAREGEKLAGLFYPVPKGASFRLFEGGLVVESGGRWEEPCALALLVGGVGGKGLSLRFVSLRVEG